MEYREGDDELKEEVKEEVVETPKEEVAETTQEVIPNTGFFVIAYADGRVDVSVEIPGLQVDHQPSMREIRDIAHSLYLDLSGSISANQFGQQWQKALMEAQKQVQSQKVKPFAPQIVRPTR
jgi:hypothetical protein